MKSAKKKPTRTKGQNLTVKKIEEQIERGRKMLIRDNSKGVDLLAMEKRALQKAKEKLLKRTD